RVPMTMRQRSDAGLDLAITVDDGVPAPLKHLSVAWARCARRSPSSSTKPLEATAMTRVLRVVVASSALVGSLIAATPATAQNLGTVCSYTFADVADGWRTHYWTAADCSNGLPGSGWVGAAQGQNGSGTSGQVQCLVGSGSHYNHPTWA